MKTYLSSKFLLFYDLPSCIFHFFSNCSSQSPLLTLWVDHMCSTRSCHKIQFESRSLRIPLWFSQRRLEHLHRLCPYSLSTDIHGQKLENKIIIWITMSVLAYLPATASFECNKTRIRIDNNIITKFEFSLSRMCSLRSAYYQYIPSAVHTIKMFLIKTTPRVHVHIVTLTQIYIL